MQPGHCKFCHRSKLMVILARFSRFCICHCFSNADHPPGYDRVRNAVIGNKDFELETLEEAFTTENWIVRIFRVKKFLNRGHV